MKKLKEILANVEIVKTIGNLDCVIKGIQIDSRLIENEQAFIALKGTNSDGHQFIDNAIEKGAGTIICEILPERFNNKINYILLKNSELSLPLIASNYFDNPAEKLIIIGVTGTNGKTTVASLLCKLFNETGFKSGLISTVLYNIGDRTYPSTHTTPNTLVLNSLFAEMINAGCKYCFMEVSSHALDQNRIGGIHFRGAIFTNITHDHLDYHKTFSRYLSSKKKLFDDLLASSFSLVNVDDKNALIMVQNTASSIYTYSCKTDADFKGKSLEGHFDSTLMKINNDELWTNFTGGFNVSNLTAVYATAVLCGIEKEKVLMQLSLLKPVSGRFETVRIFDITGIIDYAHTPDALENIYKTINEIKLKGQDLITVLGAGGDRDKTKRPEMARLAVKNSNKVILTSDNPRTEPPAKIIDDMELGVTQDDRKKVLRIEDRKEAIKTACLFAKKGDIILIAGKGHETYQEINGIKYDFDDKKNFIEQMEIIKS